MYLSLNHLFNQQNHKVNYDIIPKFSFLNSFMSFLIILTNFQKFLMIEASFLFFLQNNRLIY